MELAQLVGRSCQLCQVTSPIARCAAPATAAVTFECAVAPAALAHKPGLGVACQPPLVNAHTLPIDAFLSPGPPLAPPPLRPWLQAALRADGVKVMELISKDPSSLSTVDCAQEQQRWQRCLQVMHLSGEQQEGLLLNRRSHLARMRAIYQERHNLNMEVGGWAWVGGRAWGGWACGRVALGGWVARQVSKGLAGQTGGLDASACAP